MTAEELRKIEIIRKERDVNRMSRFIRARMMAQELGVKIIAMDFSSGLALVKFDGETGPLLAATHGGEHDK